MGGWREAWEAARWRIEAIGCKNEPFSNLTISVTPGGEVSIRLPKPLEHLANAKRGRYTLSSTAIITGNLWIFLLHFPLANLGLFLVFARTARGNSPIAARLAAEVIGLRSPPSTRSGCTASSRT